MAGKIPKKRERPGIDRLGRTELHYAASRGDVAGVQTLLAAGAKADLPDDNGWTPLHFATQAHSVEASEALLAAGASVDSQDSDGNTPLSNAVFNSCGRGELIALLRRHGANPYLANIHGVSPLALARTIANYDVQQYFNDLPGSESGKPT
jgi:ankyrin repeat protein